MVILLNNRKRTKSRYLKKQLKYIKDIFIKGLASSPEDFSIETEIDGIDNGKNEITVRVTIYPKQPIMMNTYKLMVNKNE